MSDKNNGSFRRFAEKVFEWLDDAEDVSRPSVDKAIEYSKEWLKEAEQVSHEEAEKFASYLRRDMAQAGHNLSVTGEAISKWLGIDVAVAEDKLFSGFISVADKTQTEWVEFNDELAHGGTYGSGEYAVAGKLKCEHCGQVIQLRHFSRIPPCPKCHKVQFQRAH